MKYDRWLLVRSVGAEYSTTVTPALGHLQAPARRGSKKRLCVGRQEAASLLTPVSRQSPVSHREEDQEEAA